MDTVSKSKAKFARVYFKTPAGAASQKRRNISPGTIRKKIKLLDKLNLKSTPRRLSELYPI